MYLGPGLEPRVNEFGMFHSVEEAIQFSSLSDAKAALARVPQQDCRIIGYAATLPKTTLVDGFGRKKHVSCSARLPLF
jgi:hypothetical protein